MLVMSLVSKIYINFRIKLQNVLTTFPVLLSAFEVFTKPLFMLLFLFEFLSQLMNAWSHNCILLSHDY